MEKYCPQSIEKKWQKIWDETKAYQINMDPNKPKYYVLEMFPYHLVIYIWDMFAITPSVMLLLVIKL